MAGIYISNAGGTGPQGPTGPTGPAGAGVTPYYGSFYDTTTQTNLSSVNQVKIANSADHSGISLSSNAITLTNAGTYLIDLQCQLYKSGGGNSSSTSTFWYAVNGSNHPNSAFTYSVYNSGAWVLVNVDDIYVANAGDILTFYWNASDSNVGLYPQAATVSPAMPASPSVNLNIWRVA